MLSLSVWKFYHYVDLDLDLFSFLLTLVSECKHNPDITSRDVSQVSKFVLWKPGEGCRCLLWRFALPETRSYPPTHIVSHRFEVYCYISE